MQLWTWVVLYLLVGALFATKGPAARKISWEVQRTPPTSKTKLRVFKFILVLAIVFFWPVLVISIIRTEKRQSDIIAALSSADNALKVSNNLSATNQSPVDADLLPNASGEFGYSPDNPVPTTNILETEKYIRRLRHSDGQLLQFRRIGSFSSQSTELPVDGYRVEATRHDEEPVVLYFSPYHLRCSRLAPRGFKFAKTELLKRTSENVATDPPVAPKPTTVSSLATVAERVEAVGLLDTIRKRADDGDLDAQVELGFHLLAQPPTAENALIGERWLTHAAQQGHARAQYELGNILAEGRLLPWNLKQARHWMGAAAAQNYRNAREQLAAMPVYADSQIEQTKTSILTVRENNLHAPVPQKESLSQRPKQAGRKAYTARQRVSTDPHYWDSADSENQKYYAKGKLAALECFSRARKRIEGAIDGYSIWTDFDRIGDEARAIAKKRGLLRIGEDHGMSEIDGSDLFFDERRAAFINGVEDALEEPDQFRNEQ